MQKLILFFLFIPIVGIAQNRNDIWCFGDSAGIDFSNLSQPVPIHSVAKSRGSCASICDTNGNLLFYSSYDTDIFNGVSYLANGEVYNKQHQLMANGDSLNYQSWYMECVIIPFPDDTLRYYLFTIGVTSNYGLYYNVIDMSLDSGRGKVTQKNIQLLSSPANDGLTAVKHGNGRDWWIIHRKHQGSNNTFYKFLISPSGISVPDTQNIGSYTQTNLSRYIFNKTGDKLAMVLYDGLIETFDFDRCTGLLSNHIVIRPKNTSPPTPSLWSCAFSPNNRFLYVSSSDIPSSSLIQIDLQDSTPWANADTIWSDSTCAFEGGALRLAPDDKIYLTCSWNDGSNNYPYPDTLHNTVIDNLSIINSPDSPGTSCNFTPFSFYLGGNRTYWGLPNNPDYDLPRIAGSPCDTVQWVAVQNIVSPNGEMFVTYVSDWEKAFINAKNIKGKNVMLKIYDVQGREVFSSIKKTQPPYYTQDVDCGSLSKGMYVVVLKTEKERLVKKFVKN